ncbi:MAG: OmpA family protein [Polyangiaceae bacterium]|jgi:outer membrane protein OmpA-like peptidoglycan-associated protein
MHWNRTATVALPLAFSGLLACGASQLPPRSLIEAREEFVRAKDGLAMQLDPTDVHEADVALQRAEQAWQSSPDDARTTDLIIIADRKALIAESQAAAIKAEQDTQDANRQVEALRASQLQSAQGQLSQTRQVLGATQMQLQQQQETSAAQQQKMQALEAKLKDARDTIAKIASVKDDDRGMVITLQGEVLFKTAKSDLKPGAMAKLDEIAEALRGKEQPIVVYGFTDNVGTRENNMDLSQRRADSVRSYLVSKGLPQDLVAAQGKGPDAPVADNQSIEGRAQNRRVEIVVQPKK